MGGDHIRVEGAQPPVGPRRRPSVSLRVLVAAAVGVGLVVIFWAWRSVPRTVDEIFNAYYSRWDAGDADGVERLLADGAVLVFGGTELDVDAADPAPGSAQDLDGNGIVSVLETLRWEVGRWGAMSAATTYGCAVEGDLVRCRVERLGVMNPDLPLEFDEDLVVTDRRIVRVEWRWDEDAPSGTFFGVYRSLDSRMRAYASWLESRDAGVYRRLFPEDEPRFYGSALGEQRIWIRRWASEIGLAGG